jgi:hypothetical protein
MFIPLAKFDVIPPMLDIVLVDEIKDPLSPTTKE